MGITMKIVFSIHLIMLFLVANLYAQTTGKIAGEVRDAETGEPMAGVNILVEGTYLLIHLVGIVY